MWLVEDVKTDKGAKAKNALQPSGFLYRLIPKDKADLSKGGTLQALQVVNADGVAIEFHAGQADADILSGDNQQLYSYGTHFKTHWVTLHDTATDGTQAFDANASAKHIPVVMISGKDGFFDKVRGRMAGTTGYITKPFGPETLMKALETYLVQDDVIAE